MNVKLTNNAIEIVQRIMSNDPEWKWDLDCMVEPWSDKSPGCTIEIAKNEAETEKMIATYVQNGYQLKDSTCFGYGSASYEMLCFTI